MFDGAAIDTIIDAENNDVNDEHVSDNSSDYSNLAQKLKDKLKDKQEININDFKELLEFVQIESNSSVKNEVFIEKVSLSPSDSDRLDSIKNQTQEILHAFSNSVNVELNKDQLSLIFGEDFDEKVLKEILENWKDKNFSDLPEIELAIMSSNEENVNVYGGYISSEQTVVLDTDVLTQTNTQAVMLLLEEYGHYISDKISKEITKIDTGHAFATSLFGTPIFQVETTKYYATYNDKLVELEPQIYPFLENQGWVNMISGIRRDGWTRMYMDAPAERFREHNGWLQFNTNGYANLNAGEQSQYYNVTLKEHYEGGWYYAAIVSVVGMIHLELHGSDDIRYHNDSAYIVGRAEPPTLLINESIILYAESNGTTTYAQPTQVDITVTDPDSNDTHSLEIYGTAAEVLIDQGLKYHLTDMRQSIQVSIEDEAEMAPLRPGQERHYSRSFRVTDSKGLQSAYVELNVTVIGVADHPTVAIRAENKDHHLTSAATFQTVKIFESPDLHFEAFDEGIGVNEATIVFDQFQGGTDQLDHIELVIENLHLKLNDTTPQSTTNFNVQLSKYSSNNDLEYKLKISSKNDDGSTLHFNNLFKSIALKMKVSEPTDNPNDNNSVSNDVTETIRFNYALEDIKTKYLSHLPFDDNITLEERTKAVFSITPVIFSSENFYTSIGYLDGSEYLDNHSGIFRDGDLATANHQLMLVPNYIQVDSMSDNGGEITIRFYDSDGNISQPMTVSTNLNVIQDERGGKVIVRSQDSTNQNVEITLENLNNLPSELIFSEADDTLTLKMLGEDGAVLERTTIADVSHLSSSTDPLDINIDETSNVDITTDSGIKVTMAPGDLFEVEEDPYSLTITTAHNAKYTFNEPIHREYDATTKSYTFTRISYPHDPITVHAETKDKIFNFNSSLGVGGYSLNVTDHEGIELVNIQAESSQNLTLDGSSDSGSFLVKHGEQTFNFDTATVTTNVSLNSDGYVGEFTPKGLGNDAPPFTVDGTYDKGNTNSNIVSQKFSVTNGILDIVMVDPSANDVAGLSFNEPTLPIKLKTSGSEGKLDVQYGSVVSEVTTTNNDKATLSFTVDGTNVTSVITLNNDNQEVTMSNDYKVNTTPDNSEPMNQTFEMLSLSDGSVFMVTELSHSANGISTKLQVTHNTTLNTTEGIENTTLKLGGSDVTVLTDLEDTNSISATESSFTMAQKGFEATRVDFSSASTTSNLSFNFEQISDGTLSVVKKMNIAGSDPQSSKIEISEETPGSLTLSVNDTSDTLTFKDLGGKAITVTVPHEQEGSGKATQTNVNFAIPDAVTLGFQGEESTTIEGIGSSFIGMIATAEGSNEYAIDVDGDGIVEAQVPDGSEVSYNSKRQTVDIEVPKYGISKTINSTRVPGDVFSLSIAADGKILVTGMEPTPIPVIIDHHKAPETRVNNIFYIETIQNNSPSISSEISDQVNLTNNRLRLEFFSYDLSEKNRKTILTAVGSILDSIGKTNFEKNLKDTLSLLTPEQRIVVLLELIARAQKELTPTQRQALFDYIIDEEAENLEEIVEFITKGEKGASPQNPKEALYDAIMKPNDSDSTSTNESTLDSNQKDGVTSISLLKKLLKKVINI